MNDFSYSASSLSPKQIMTRSLSKVITNNELMIEGIKTKNQTLIEQRAQNSLQLLNVMTVIVFESLLPEEIKSNLTSLFSWFENTIKQAVENWMKNEEEITQNLKILIKPIKNIREAFREMPET